MRLISGTFCVHTSTKVFRARGDVHVFRFRRPDEGGPPHISYKYFWQSPTWLPEDGSSLKILNSRPDLRTARLRVCDFYEGSMDAITPQMKKLLRWLAKHRTLGLTTESHVDAWKTYFRQLPKTPTPSFP